MRSRSHGLRVTPQLGDSVAPMMASSGRLVLPMITAPAARSRRTSSASSAAGPPWAAVPWVVTSPATSVVSLMATGTPSSGRSSPPGAAPVGLVGLGQRAVGHDRPVGVHLRVDPLDPAQVELDQLARAELAPRRSARPGGRLRRTRRRWTGRRGVRSARARAERMGRVASVCQADASSVATAIAAMPSPRPTKPMPSLVVNLTFTEPTGTPRAPASRSRIASRWGPSLGASAMTVAST